MWPSGKKGKPIKHRLLTAVQRIDPEAILESVLPHGYYLTFEGRRRLVCRSREHLSILLQTPFIEKLRVEQANHRLGLPADAVTGRLLVNGEITEDKAREIAAKAIHRHAATDYDVLLKSGMDRDEARKAIEE